jgi:hypothetical protein
VARPDVAAGWPERQPNPNFPLQTVSGGSLPILKEVLSILTLGRRPLTMWVFVPNITDELILGLDILCAYDASVDIGCQTLQLAEEEVYKFINPTHSNLFTLSSLVITYHS